MPPTPLPATPQTTQVPSAVMDTKPKYLENLFILFYRHGMNANLTKGFYFPGDLLAARKRAEAHCKVMGYKFIFIRPMVCNLEVEEEQKLNSREGTVFA